MEAFETFRLGRTMFAVSGHGAFKRAVSAELSPVASDGPGSPEVIFRFSDSVTNGSKLPEQDRFAGRGLTASVSWADQHCPVVDIAAMLPTLYRRMPRVAFRSIHPAYADQFEHLASSFLYQIFNGLAQALNLTADQSFVHTAAIEQDGCRVAIVARGGMGKTGSVLRLVHDHGWRYLSDDWSVLDDSGIFQLSHKPVQVHPKDIAGLSDGTEFLMRHHSLADRLAWQTRRRLGNRLQAKRRMHAAALFGPQGIGSAGPLSSAYLVRRGEVDDVRNEVANIDDFVSTTAGITARELEPSLRLLRQQSTVAAPEAFRPESFPARTEEVIHRAFKRVTLRVITVPRSMPEPQIEDFLVSTIATAG